MSVQNIHGFGWANDPIRAAGGRRRWNAVRQTRAIERRAEVVKLMRTYGIGRGSQTKIAAALGVSDATISRDFNTIFSMNDSVRCPCCGTAVQ